jgi:Ca-activated chloride channel homolog
MPRNILLAKPLRARYLLVVLLAIPTLGQGQILPGPDGPPPDRRRPIPPPTRGTELHLKYLSVITDITDGVAVTTVKQTFRNQSGRPIEGTYVFPLPAEAAVGSFNMTVNGQKMKGEVLDAATARRTYEEIVRRTRDPGLLEYLGGQLYRASIFPIPPGGLAEIELQYAQTLRESGGLALFQHPLHIATAGDQPIEQLVFQVKLHSQVPLTSVFCPTHQCEILRPNDREATVSFEQANVRPDADFQLYYQRSDAMFGISLLTHRGAGEPGYFLLRIAPRIEIGQDKVQAKDIAFVIDTSGSMRGAKIDQVKQALKFCISSLNERDRFNIYSFSTEVHPFRDGLVPASGDIKAAATEFAAGLEALGGTNINQALLAALASDPHEGDRPYLIVFMTDGRPTVDVTDADAILRNVGDKNSRRVRFHVLGVGTDVNTQLLDKLAELNRGTREYCGEKEDLELKLSALVGRLSSPVLTDITLRIAGLKTSDIYPQALPDLFRGGDLVVLGRYDGSGDHAVEINGRLLTESHSIIHEASFSEKESKNDFLPRLWAQRKVAYLLDQIRLNGQNSELVDEVVRLAKRFGIVTPYTAALILEDGERVALGQERHREFRPTPAADGLRRAAKEKSDKSAAAGGAIAGAGRMGAAGAPTGQAAVDASKALDQDRRSGSVATSSPVESGGKQVVRHVGDKTFVLVEERWLDTTWDGEKKPQKVVAFSDEYFKLLEKHPELGRFFAIGERVVVVAGDTVYETVPEPADANGK